MRAFLALLPAYTLSIFYRSFLSVIAAPLMADLEMNPAQFSALGRSGSLPSRWRSFRWAMRSTGSGHGWTAAVPLAIGTIGGVVFALAPNYPWR